MGGPLLCKGWTPLGKNLDPRMEVNKEYTILHMEFWTRVYSQVQCTQKLGVEVKCTSKQHKPIVRCRRRSLQTKFISKLSQNISLQEFEVEMALAMSRDVKEGNFYVGDDLILF